MKQICFILTFTFQCLCSLVLGQDVNKHFDFTEDAEKKYVLATDDLLVTTRYHKKKKSKHLITIVANRKSDSLSLKNESFKRVIVKGSDAFLYFDTPQKVIRIDKILGKILETIDLPDSITFLYQTHDSFIGISGLVLYKYDPQKKSTSILYDFSKIEELNDLKKRDIPIAIGHVLTNTKNQFLVKIGIVWSDATDDPSYYLYDANSNFAKKIFREKLEPLVAEPREKLKDQPEYNRYDFSPDIRDMNTYYDISDSLFYVKYDFRYEYRSKDGNSMVYKTYEQDLFVMDNQCNLIGRSLERKIYDWMSKGFVYKGNKREWLCITSEVDSTKSILDDVFFKIKIKYSLEKCFYDIYYNQVLSKNDLIKFDKYELLLVKNFIFAKHNYKFKMRFFQAYFNTFVFYSDKKKKSSRVTDVNKLLTQSDKKNLQIINAVIGK
jgi:hypothetical protein